MRTNFTREQLAVPAMARSNEELQACLQCGYCLAYCPTYKLCGDEADSPRGRLYLIREMLESGGKPDDKTVGAIDRCLLCLTCMSACPSRVHYMHVMDHAREYIEENHRRPLSDRVLRWLLARILPYPGRLRLAMHGARLIKPLALAMPGRIRGMVSLVPRKLPWFGSAGGPQIFSAEGERQRRVALLTGCVQQVLGTNINDATIRILRRHGCEVVVAEGVGCCGALMRHMGKAREGRAMAARNIRAWMKEINGDGLDAIVINASGCGTVVKDYGHVFRDEDDLMEEAGVISTLAKDVSEILSDIDLAYKATPPLRVAYHATCSLQFGQRIRFMPKKLLRAAGFIVLEPDDSHACCGSAGTYHVLQPEISTRLKQRKVETLEHGAPDVIATGNIGCLMQIRSGTRLPVVHTVELLDWATGGPMPKALEGSSEAAIPGRS